LESKWRLNVAEMGWSDDPEIRMIARLLDPFPDGWYAWAFNFPVPRTAVGYVAISGTGEMFHATFGYDGGLGFPHGLPVEPDHP